MTKKLTYSGFVLASLLVVLVFVTAKSYSQLAFAAVLYPPLILSALNIFPRNPTRQPKITIQPPPGLENDRSKTPKQKLEPTFVADIDKRAFIKLIGATGVSFFLFSLLGRRAESFFFGRTGQFGINQTGSSDQTGLAGPSPTDGYKISEIDEGIITYYGFINKEGAWLIMREDSDTSNFRYVKGNSDFPGNWSNRENLKYDYFYNLS